MTERRFTFDKVAGTYQAARPDYPDALFDDLAADLKTGDPLLEIGSGTGKATEGFARRGFSVLAIEPGADMIRVAKEHLANYPKVRFVQSTFENWPVEAGAFRLVYAAQAFHWVPPAIAFVKSAEALMPAGRLAVFGNVAMPLPSPLREELAAIYKRHTGEEQTQMAEAWYLPSGPLPMMFKQSGLFEPAAFKSYSRTKSYTSEEFAALLSTHSVYQMLDPGLRNVLLTDIANEIDAQGGALELTYETHLCVARRL